MHNWKVTGVDTHSSEHKAVVDLVNKGILEIPKTEDGKYTNIASINTKDAITKEEIVALSQKVNINPNQFNHVKTKGEFYKKLNKIIEKM
ncbi:5'-nucleotidase [Bacillus mycoides]|uniref:5'-nucleotidase n=2 Tax=Bacillus mycoides TaxID=1405 RepID=C2Y2L4_BACMY|nr:5'-nucleotidase [Bacillus mycoides]